MFENQKDLVNYLFQKLAEHDANFQDLNAVMRQADYSGIERNDPDHPLNCYEQAFVELMVVIHTAAIFLLKGDPLE